MSQKRNLEIHTLPQGSLLWFIPHIAVSIKGVHLYKEEISILNRDDTYFIIEADSLGVTGVWTYYSSGDVHLGKACHKVQGIWMFNTYSASSWCPP